MLHLSVVFYLLVHFKELILDKTSHKRGKLKIISGNESRIRDFVSYKNTVSNRCLPPRKYHVIYIIFSAFPTEKITSEFSQ
jgi:hypothetical protein